MPSHEHQWVFAGEVVIPTRTNEVHGDPFNRLEYCVDCGAFRIQFKQHWRYWYSDATKKFLGQFNRETHKVLKISPSEFRIAPPARDSNRLGRGLKDIAMELVGGKGWKGVFKLPPELSALTSKKGK